MSHCRRGPRLCKSSPTYRSTTMERHIRMLSRTHEGSLQSWLGCSGRKRGTSQGSEPIIRYAGPPLGRGQLQVVFVKIPVWVDVQLIERLGAIPACIIRRPASNCSAERRCCSA